MNADQLVVATRLRVRKNIVTHIKRQMPMEKGRLHVVLGQEVSPGDVLGEGQTPMGFRTIHLTGELGDDPKKAILDLKRRIGQTIFQGELLAEKHDLFGLRKKMLLSPVDGVIDFYDGEKGNLRIKLIPKQVKLISSVYGIVDGVDAKTGTILIRSLVSAIYGVLGSGKEREGILKLIGSPEDLISSKQIAETTRGQILAGGAMVFPEALHKAVGLQVAGIISGGINASDFKTIKGGKLDVVRSDWSDVGLSLMVTEGFGSICMGDDVYTTLREHAGKVAILDGNRARLILPINDQSSMIYIRKTKLPPKAVLEEGMVTGEAEVKVGVSVRVLSSPVLGSQGKVEAIDRTLSELPSGIKTFMVTVATKSRKLRVPYQNLEIVA